MSPLLRKASTPSSEPRERTVTPVLREVLSFARDVVSFRASRASPATSSSCLADNPDPWSITVTTGSRCTVIVGRLAAPDPMRLEAVGENPPRENGTGASAVATARLPALRWSPRTAAGPACTAMTRTVGAVREPRPVGGAAPRRGVVGAGSWELPGSGSCPRGAREITRPG